VRYLLAILTCGRPAYLERTLDSYVAFLDPPPSGVYAYDDGGQTPLETFERWEGVPVRVESHPDMLGRCAAHANLWRAAAASAYDWVFAIEDDIVLLRPLAVDALASLLSQEPLLAQVALVRCPWGSEIAHGGYIPMAPWKYERRRTADYEWTASTADWTNSPALFRTRLAREVEWPAEAGCEHALGPQILARHPELVSGYWGWGEPWVAHIGIDRVPGAHGY